MQEITVDRPPMECPSTPSLSGPPFGLLKHRQSPPNANRNQIPTAVQRMRFFEEGMEVRSDGVVMIH